MKRNRVLLAQVAALLATGWLIWSTSLLPRLDRQPIAAIIVRALSYTLLACLASGLIALSLYLLAARSFGRDALQMGLRTSTTAIWFAAATILLAEMSPATLPAALILVISATRLLYSQWQRGQPAEASPKGDLIQHPCFDPSPPCRFSDLIPAVISASATEAGVLILRQYPLLAAALFSMSVAMFTLHVLREGSCKTDAVSSLPRSILGFFLTLILAAGLTAGGLADSFSGGSHLQSPLERRPGPLQSARALLHKLFEKDDESKSSEPVTNLYLPPLGGTEIADSSFPGVILLQQLPELPVLAAPSVSWRKNSPDLTPIKPSSIPFSGVYWMYRPPFDRPPRTSHVQQGNPLMLSFRTTDHAPMSLEAYQKLGRAVDPQCCSAVQIAISNADPYPGTVALELIIIDSKSPDQPMLSLGIVAVVSRTHSAFGQVLPAKETLQFKLPSSLPLRAFDVIKVIFHRDRLRIERSARISIDRFLLLPRSR